MLSWSQLLWIILLASCAALVIQSLAANLGVVTGLYFLRPFILCCHASEICSFLMFSLNALVFNVLCRKAFSWALSKGIPESPKFYFVDSCWNSHSCMRHSWRLDSRNNFIAYACFSWKSKISPLTCKRTLSLGYLPCLISGRHYCKFEPKTCT